MFSGPLATPLVIAGGALLALVAIYFAVRDAGLGKPRPPRRRRPVWRWRSSLGAPSRQGRRVWPGLVGGLLVVLVLAGVEAGNAVPALRDLQIGADRLRSAAATLGTDPAGWTDARIAEASSLRAQAQPRLDRSARRLGDDAVLRLARHLPWASDQAGGLLALARSSAGASTALGDLIEVARNYRAAAAAGGSTGHRVLDLLKSSQAPMADADRNIHPAVADLRTSLRPGLLRPLRTQIERAITLLSPIDDTAQALGAAGSAVSALGADGPRTYLVLLQNPAEIRPSGGFAGAVGVVTINGGDPSGLQVRNQEAFKPPLKQKFPVPYPLNRYLKFTNNNLEIGDAGWDPDFPTSAALAEQMYTAATRTHLDGTVAIDPYAISSLLKVTGPVEVGGYGRFDSANFFPQLDYIVNASSERGAGKQALGPIAQAVLQQVVIAPVSQWPRLLVAFREQAIQRHIQVSLHDQKLALASARARWDGALVGASADYLMVSDANVGATKGDYYVHKSSTLKVDLATSGLARHQLTLDYAMPAPADAVDVALNPGDGSYRDYVRIYLPETASIADFSWRMDGGLGEGGLDSLGMEHGKRVVGAFFRLPRGHKGQLTLTYAVPLDPSTTMELLVQKQAGAQPHDLKVVVQADKVRRTAQLTLDRDQAVAL